MNSRINGSLMRYSWYIYPSGNQTWRAGKSLIYRLVSHSNLMISSLGFIRDVHLPLLRSAPLF